MFTVSTSLLLNQVKPQLRPCNRLQQPTQAWTARKILVPYFYWEWTIEINQEKEQQTGTASNRKRKKKKKKKRPPMMDRQNCSSYRQYPRLTRINHSGATALLRLQNKQRLLWPRWRWTIRHQSKQPSNDTIASKKQKSQSAHNKPQNSPEATTEQIEGTVPTMMSLLAG